MIRFENLSTATAPAHQVAILHFLDGDLDLDSFQLESFGFGHLRFDIPAGQDSYQARVEISDELFVDFAAELNRDTRLVTWSFMSIDPQTLDIPADPELGFLPLNLVSPDGEGFVEFSIQPLADLPTGTRIDAIARIFFDANDPIDTPAIFNTLDAGAPTSSIGMLPPQVLSESFAVSWSGADDAGGSGIATFDVYVSEDGGPFLPLLLATTETSTIFTGQVGRTYGFYSVARDLVGFVQPTPLGAQVTTTIVAAQPTAEAGGPYTVAEGGTVALSGSGTDPLDDPAELTFAWDLDGDGTFETLGASPTFDATSLDGPISRIVTLRVTNASGNSVTDTATIAIQNVAPTAFIGGPYTGVAATTI